MKIKLFFLNPYFILVFVIIAAYSCTDSSKDITDKKPVTQIDTSSSDLGVWVKKADMPTSALGRVGRAFATVFVIDHYAYVGSGQSNISGDPMLNDFWKYDPSNDSWTEIAPISQGRESAVSFVVNGMGYVGTGYDNNTDFDTVRKFYNDFYQYNVGTNSWKKIADFPGTPRCNSVAFSINNKGYVAGGLGSDTGWVAYNDMYSYDPSNDSWEKVSAFPGNGRYNAAAFVYNNEAYLFGGMDAGGSVQPQFCKYSPNSDSWNVVQDLANYTSDPVSGKYINEGSIIPRASAVSFVIDSVAFISGGYANVPTLGADLLPYTWAYYFKSGRWERRPSFTGTLFVGGVGFAINNKGFIGTGIYTAGFPGNGITSNEFYEFVPDSASVK